MLHILLLIILFDSSNLRTAEMSEKSYVDIEIYLWSHNDYEQENPLYDALDHGAQMIEADVHLIDGNLYVSHDYPTDIINNPKLEDLYLEPLSERINDNNGMVLPDSRLQFYLVIDIKSEADATYKVLSELLLQYLPILNRMENGVWIDGPVRLLLSGNRPKLDQKAMNRYVFLDGRIDSLESGFESDLYPIISDYWYKYFTWDGIGQIPENELAKLRELVGKTHKEHKMIRFWGTPDRVEIWDILLSEEVDIINVDNLKKFSDYINNR